MATDLDGTAGVFINNAGTLTALTAGQMQGLADEGNGGIGSLLSANQIGYVVYIFPELRDLVAACWIQSTEAGWGTADWKFQTSADTTTGSDGTWTDRVSGGFTGQVPTKPAFRTTGTAGTANVINPLVVAGVRGVRVRGHTTTPSEFNPAVFHVYGSIATGQNPNRVDLWHPTLDQPIAGADFDLGDIQQLSTATKTFRIKNRSSTQTANSITLGMIELTPSIPSATSQSGLSSDGTTFTSSLSLGNLAPGALSGVLTYRRISSVTASLGPWSMRLAASAASWT
jgi:hypothetical protein